MHVNKQRSFFVKSHQPYGGGSLMLWGCFAALGALNVCRALWNQMTNKAFWSQTYRPMSESCVLVTGHGSSNRILTPNKKWMRINHWTVLKWSAMSPDLNYIGHLWIELKLAVGSRHPSNLKELGQFALEEWVDLQLLPPRAELQNIKRTNIDIFICFIVWSCESKVLVIFNVKLRTTERLLSVSG